MGNSASLLLLVLGPKDGREGTMLLMLDFASGLGRVGMRLADALGLSAADFVGLLDHSHSRSFALLSQIRTSERRINSLRRCSLSTLSSVPRLRSVLPGDMRGNGRFGVDF